MRRVSRVFDLLMGCVCGVSVMVLASLRCDTPRWAEAQFGVDLSWSFFPLLSVAIGVTGIVPT